MDPIQEELLQADAKGPKEPLPIPEELPILPLSGIVLFPDIIAPLLVGKENYVRLVDEAVLGDKLIGVVAQKKSDEEQEPSPDNLFSVGTAAKVLKMMKLPTGGVSFIIQGISRIKVEQYEKTRAGCPLRPARPLR